MKINKALNLTYVIPQDDGSKIHVFSTPVSWEVFDSFALIIQKTFSVIYEEAIARSGGMRIAGKLLKKMAMADGVWEDAPGSPGSGVENGLIREIERLTNVFVRGDKEWETIPLHEAIRKGYLDSEDVTEVHNALVFFTVLYCGHNKADRATMLKGACALWGAPITSLSFTEYRASLPMSTQDETSGEKKPEESKPENSQALPNPEVSQAPY